MIAVWTFVGVLVVGTALAVALAGGRRGTVVGGLVSLVLVVPVVGLALLPPISSDGDTGDGHDVMTIRNGSDRTIVVVEALSDGTFSFDGLDSGWLTIPGASKVVAFGGRFSPQNTEMCLLTPIGIAELTSDAPTLQERVEDAQNEPPVIRFDGSPCARAGDTHRLWTGAELMPDPDPVVVDGGTDDELRWTVGLIGLGLVPMLAGLAIDRRVRRLRT